MRHFGNLIIRRAFVSKAATAPRPSTTPVIPTMRDYQRECVQICLDSLAQGARKQVVSLPVGEFYLGCHSTFSFNKWLIRKWQNGNDPLKMTLNGGGG